MIFWYTLIVDSLTAAALAGLDAMTPVVPRDAEIIDLEAYRNKRKKR